MEDVEKNALFTEINSSPSSVEVTDEEHKFCLYRVGLRFYGERIRHVMQELDSDILGIEMEERERIGGVFVPGVKS